MNKLKLYSTILLVMILGGCLSQTTTTGLTTTNPGYTTEKFNVAVEGVTVEKQISAYLVKETSYGGKKLKIWIDTSKYTDSSKIEAVKLGDQFLNGSNTNDIYHWITNVFGEEWGTTAYNDLIKDEDTIHILVTPLNTSYSANFVMGYFNPSDTFVNDGTTTTNSNQKTMFYIDSNLLTGNLPSSWTDKNKKDIKKDIYSTLAHEFVHMINWYQKDILRNVIITSKGTDTWLNETMAMMGEDLVDDKITVDGVLGVPGSKSRIPEFNYEFNTLDINDKNNTIDDTTYGVGDYAVDGVYGLYLNRVYSGKNVLFARNIMQNSNDGMSAINSALSSIGSSKAFTDTVFDFGKSVILSDQNKSVDVTDEICFNQTLSNNGYNFEAINLYTYGTFYYLANSLPLQNVGNNYAQLRKSTDTSSSQTWTMSLPNSLGKYTISGNFSTGETVYVVFTGLNTSGTASNVGQIAFTGITTNIVKNLVGPQIIDNDKKVIDYGIIAREKAFEQIRDKWNIKESTTLPQKSVSSGTPGIKFEIIVKNSSGIYDKAKSQSLEDTMIKAAN